MRTISTANLNVYYKLKAILNMFSTNFSRKHKIYFEIFHILYNVLFKLSGQFQTIKKTTVINFFNTPKIIYIFLNN